METTPAKPDPSLFSVNEQPRKYTATVRIVGSTTIFVEADSLEEARRQVETMIKADDFEPDLDEIDDADIDYLRKDPPLYRAWRDGKKIQTSHLRSGDTPRDPDENGF